jgi:CheY-like chemotaxis protein
LLNLINDILDLSKIEAGRMEVRPQTVWLSELINDLGQSLRPLAEQKGLSFGVSLSHDCPDAMHTDRQRLEQVLKNLLANAIKFTDKGEVTLTAMRTSDNRLAFEVTDTGIGIPEDQRQSIFEAFRQVDGAANRKYSGTGLGLSISRELTRLLGGEIRVSSRPDHGSSFTVILPLTYQPVASSTPNPVRSDVQAGSEIPNSQQQLPAVAVHSPQAPAPSANFQRPRDDRDKLFSNRRVILVVEDDEAFARILYDLAHELDFQCLISTSGEEALAMAVQYMPSAIALDIGLPDQSGLAVLDRLKTDARTRHIPVHVVSANDYSEAALSLGAVGYMLKPITREKLVEAFEGLETRARTESATGACCRG